jgi:hypothetical protein
MSFQIRIPFNLPMSSSLSDNVLAAHREVQRKFGRNLLRLQQYELLLKTLVSERLTAGPAAELRSIQEQRKDEVSKKTLGQVVGELTESYITQPLPSSESDEFDQQLGDPTQPWVSLSIRIEMEEGGLNRTRQRLAELVDLRNDLVHHFLETHDVWTESGCLAADAHLDDSFKLIDAQYKELRQLAEHISEMRTDMGAFINSPEFRDFAKHGIMPDGAGVFWDSSTIVRLLRDAEDPLAQDGWTELRRAIDHIGKKEPEHTPKRYGCNSWRQVLHESKQFEVRKDQATPGAPTKIWYRSRRNNDAYSGLSGQRLAV